MWTGQQDGRHCKGLAFCHSISDSSDVIWCNFSLDWFVSKMIYNVKRRTLNHTRLNSTKP